jgi:hypothetical protein
LSKSRADQLIVISLFVLLASTVGGHLAEGKREAKGKGKGEHFGRRITGGFLTMLFASLFAEIAPEVGALLAISIASYAFFHDGLPVIVKKTATPEANLEQAIREKGGTVFPPLSGPAPQQTSSPVTFGGQTI